MIKHAIAVALMLVSGTAAAHPEHTAGGHFGISGQDAAQVNYEDYH